MQPTEDVLIYLIDESQRSYKVNSLTRLVEVSSIPTPINELPANFDKQVIKWVRSKSYHGVITSFTPSFSFVRDGAKIIRHIFYRKINNAFATLVVQVRDNFNKYRDFFVGDIDFSNIIDTQGASQGEGVSCGAVDSGLNTLIAANRATTYEIPIDVPEAINVTMDGVEMFSEVKVIHYPDTVLAGDNTVQCNIRNEHVINIGMTIPSTETVYPSVLWNNQTLYLQKSNRNNINSAWPTDWLFKCTDDSVIKVRIPSFTFRTSGVWEIGFWIYNDFSSTNRFVLLANGDTGGFSVQYDINISIDLNVNKNELGWFIIDSSLTAGTGMCGNPSFSSENCTFIYNYRKPATIVKWLPPMYVLEKIVEKMTLGKYAAYSDLFKITLANYLMSSGDAIRGLSGAVLKISLDNLLKSYNAAFPLSLNTNEGKVRVETEGFAYNDSVIVDLGEVSSLETSISDEHIYNRFKFGWPEKTYNDVNGKYEFNTNATYGTTLIKGDKEYDGTSFARADSIGMEILRINLDNKKTTDSNSDSDCFILDSFITGANTAIINRPADIQVFGIPSGGSVFNIRLSPARCAMAHGSKMRAAFMGSDIQTVNYITKNKNSDIHTLQGGVTISERSGINILSLPKSLYLPVRFNIGVKTVQQIRDYINVDPGGQVVFTWYVNGSPVVLRGFIMEASQDPCFLSQQKFDILCAPDVNITKLEY